MRIIRLALLMITMATFTGCGGGGGASSPPAARTTAVLKIGTQGTLPAGVTGLSGVGITLTLPQGVTVATDSNGNPAANIAIVSGVASSGSLAPPIYTPPTGTTGATLKLVIAAGSQLFSIGDFVTVTCLLPSNNTLLAGSFPESILSDLQPADQLIRPVSGLSPTVTASLY